MRTILLIIALLITIDGGLHYLLKKDKLDRIYGMLIIIWGLLINICLR